MLKQFHDSDADKLFDVGFCSVFHLLRSCVPRSHSTKRHRLKLHTPAVENSSGGGAFHTATKCRTVWRPICERINNTVEKCSWSRTEQCCIYCAAGWDIESRHLNVRHCVGVIVGTGDGASVGALVGCGVGEKVGCYSEKHSHTRPKSVLPTTFKWISRIQTKS